MKSFGLSDSLGIAPSNVCPDCGQSSTIEHRLCVNCLLKRALGPDQTSTEGDASFDEFLSHIEVPDREWRLGNYEILEEIARGGMGVVYRARQRHSRRIVALKRILSFHADSRETLERFRREAEAAASLDHANILPIYEVSESEGMPFFSMKYAAGGSLRDAAPALRFDPKACVSLLAKVSRATEYAHSQGILHRDLKPGNILLDSRGEPFVSDFGLAKWLDTSTDLTRTLTVFGTPGYIAPEQAEGATPNLTPAADVYSLGAVLFDLLAGRPPFLGEHALAVIKQAAEKPAPKLRSIVPTADRDLETICARCLEREPEARYQSAAALADDLECWLEGKPIKARRVLPPMRVWRWSRRNRRLVGTAAACLFLGAASIWFLWQEGWMQQISIATKRLFLSPQQAAEQSKLQAALIEYPKLDVEFQYSTMGARSGQAKLLTQNRVYSTLARRITYDSKLLTDKLPKFAAAVKRDRDAPIYEQACANYLSEDFAESERLSLKTADEAQKAGPAGTSDLISALTLAASSACKSDEFSRAREHLTDVEKLIDRERNPRQWADVEWGIANVLLSENQSSEAEKTIRPVIEVRTQILGPEHWETLSARRLLAMSLLNQAKYAEAEREYRELVKLHEKTFGPEDPETIQSHRDLAVMLSGAFGYSDPEGALIELRHILKVREEVLGPEHPESLVARHNVATALGNLGRYTEAIALRREVLPLERKIEARDTLMSLRNLGLELAQVGDFREAEATLREALRWSEQKFGAANAVTLDRRSLLAEVLAAQNEGVEAEAEAREVVKLSDRSEGPEQSGQARDLLGIVFNKQGRYAEAEAHFREALHLNEKTLGRDHDLTLINRGHLAKTLWYQGKNVEAEGFVRELIALKEKVLGAQAYTLGQNISGRGRLSEELSEFTPLTCRTLLANTLRDQGKYAEAEAEYKKVIQTEEKVLGPENFDTLDTCYHYAYQLAQQGKRDEAKLLAERAAKTAVKVLGANDPDRREYTKFFGNPGERPADPNPLHEIPRDLLGQKRGVTNKLFAEFDPRDYHGDTRLRLWRRPSAWQATDSTDNVSIVPTNDANERK